MQLGSYRLIKKLDQNHLSQLSELYRSEWWTMNRSPQDIALMLANTSLVLGFLDRDNQLVGFTRVLSDFIYKALIFDVIVHPNHRNQKMGAALMDAVMQELSGVAHLELYCLPEMVPFYQRWGFTEELGNLTLMRCAQDPE